MDVAFWKIALKPGKPMLVGTRGRQILLGLPGNPAASFVTAFLFLLLLLRTMAGARDPMPRPWHLPLGLPLPATGPRREFVRARIEPPGVVALSDQDTGSLGALAAAEALIDRAPESPPAAAGELVSLYPLRAALG